MMFDLINLEEEEERRRKELYCILNITYLHNITTYNVCTKYSCKFSKIIYVVDIY